MERIIVSSQKFSMLFNVRKSMEINPECKPEWTVLISYDKTVQGATEHGVRDNRVRKTLKKLKAISHISILYFCMHVQTFTHICALSHSFILCLCVQFFDVVNNAST